MATLTPVPSYAPGAKPTLPGFYLAYSLPAEELARLLEAHASKPAPPPPAPPPARRLRWALVAVILGVTALGVVVDRQLGFGASVFASLVPLAWLGSALVLAAGRDPAAKPGWMRGNAVKVALLSLLICGGPLGYLALVHGSRPERSQSLFLAAIGAAVVAAFGLWLDRRERPQAPAEAPRDRLGKCAAIVSALADDAMPGKPAAGWLDLTGPEQPSKLCRQGKAANGAEIRLYRDEWWRLRLPLGDGSQLRLAVVIRRKVRGDYWKQGRSRRKLKRGRAESVATIEARLTVNPQVWRVKPAVGPAPWVEGLGLSPVQAADGAVSVVARPLAAEFFEPREILAMLACLYGQLERVV
jgi:hypothetical protein